MLHDQKDQNNNRKIWRNNNDGKFKDLSMDGSFSVRKRINRTKYQLGVPEISMRFPDIRLTML